MNTAVLKLLNAEAQVWWYHRELRQQGQHTKARMCERRSILSALAHIRQAKLMTIGRGGWTVYYGHSQLQGYGGGEPYASILKGLGVPVIDSRKMPLHRVSKLAITGPMPAIEGEPDQKPYHSMSYAPLSEFVALWKLAGAQVWNAPPHIIQAA